MKGRFFRVLVFIVIFFFLFLVLIYNYRKDVCFSLLFCMFNCMDVERGLVVVYYKEGEWRVIIYENGVFLEIIVILKRNFIVKRINVEKR